MPCVACDFPYVASVTRANVSLQQNECNCMDPKIGKRYDNQELALYLSLSRVLIWKMRS